MGVYDSKAQLNTEPNNLYPTILYKVQRMKIHEDYNGKLKYQDLEHDVALLKLDRPVTFAPNIIPICIPEQDQDFGGESAWATGWGSTIAYDSRENYQLFNYPDILREVNIKLKTTETCMEDIQKEPYISYKERNGTAAPWRIKELFLCAEMLDERDTCRGDSGGPLVVQREDGRFVLAGVVSWGHGCGIIGGFYTKVSNIVDWLKFEMSY